MAPTMVDPNLLSVSTACFFVAGTDRGAPAAQCCAGLLHLEEAHRCNAGADLSARPFHFVLGLEAAHASIDPGDFFDEIDAAAETGATKLAGGLKHVLFSAITIWDGWLITLR